MNSQGAALKPDKEPFLRKKVLYNLQKPSYTNKGSFMRTFYEKIRSDSAKATRELIEKAKLTEGDILVVGCSSSEVGGERIGTSSSYDTARAVFDGINSEAERAGVFLAAQCCEHLNRALIVEKELAKRERLEAVNAVPQPKAGGSFATVAYERFSSPVAVEAIRADAGTRHRRYAHGNALKSRCSAAPSLYNGNRLRTSHRRTHPRQIRRRCKSGV